MKTQNQSNPQSRNLKILGLVVGVGLVFVVGIVLLVGTIMKNSDAYKTAVYSIEQNEAIIDETGGIAGYGFLPMGSIEITNGYGQAQLDIKVLGNEKDVKVEVALVREPNGEWDLIEMSKY